MNVFGAHFQLKTTFRKNMPEVRAILRGDYPEFVLSSEAKTVRNEIPVFTIHSVTEELFEPLAVFLRRNGYTTLTAEEFHKCLTGEAAIPERSVLLTFDDGWKSLYSVAYPLLKRYGLRAECFIIPGLIDAQEEGDANGGDDKMQDPRFHTPSRLPFCSWNEIREMHESRVIGFESHSLFHHRVPVSPVIEHFCHPGFDPGPERFNMPVMRSNGIDNLSRRVKLGTPIYRNAARLSGMKRYFDDEALRRSCTDYVTARGGTEFFRNRRWREQLDRLVVEHRKRHIDSGFFESEEELSENLLEDLVRSKAMIESKVPGKTVTHFCYPWWEGSELGVQLSKKAGYLTNFWGLVSGRKTNRRGDDPYRIVRLLSEDYILRLPGDHRRPLYKIVESRILGNYRQLFARMIRT